MTDLIIKTSHYWVHIPNTAYAPSQWINLANAIRVVQLGGKGDEEFAIIVEWPQKNERFKGIQAAALLEAVNEMMHRR